MPKISEVRGREILDSRGNPTVEAELAKALEECIEAFKAIVAEGRKNGHVIDPKKGK